MRDLKWSESEKKIARRAFEGAVQKESASVLGEVRRLAAKAESPDELWSIHDYLGERRREIDGKYDYRYSQLIFVFGRLLREGWIKEKDIEGLSEEKLQAIRKLTSI